MKPELFIREERGAVDAFAAYMNVGSMMATEQNFSKLRRLLDKAEKKVIREVRMKKMSGVSVGRHPYFQKRGSFDGEKMVVALRIQFSDDSHYQDILKMLDGMGFKERAMNLAARVAESFCNASTAPRPSCPKCVLKHLSQACVLFQESLQGYPTHRWLAIGHMAEAEAESQAIASKFADLLRQERKKAEQSEYVPDCEKLIEHFSGNQVQVAFTNGDLKMAGDFTEWSAETDFPGGTGDAEALSAIEEGGDTDESVDGDATLTFGVDEPAAAEDGADEVEEDGAASSPPTDKVVGDDAAEAVLDAPADGDAPDLSVKIDELSKELDNIRSDGKVDPGEVMGLLNQLMGMVQMLVEATPAKTAGTRVAKVWPSKESLEKYLKEHPKANPSNHTVDGGAGGAGGKKEDDPSKSPAKGDVPAKGVCKEEPCEIDPDSGVQIEEDIVDDYRHSLPDYKLELLAGKGGVLDKARIENAKDIKSKLEWLAGRIESGLKESADLCKMNPPVCRENMGLERNQMPQTMDKPVKQLRAAMEDNEFKALSTALASAKKDNPAVPLDTVITDKKQRKRFMDRQNAEFAIAAGADPDDDRSVLTGLLEGVQSEGHKVENGTVPVGELRATQSEIKADKTYGMANAYLKGDPGMLKAMEDPIIISSDNHILDGHHRYSAMLTADPTYEMKVIKVDMPMKDFLMRAHQHPGVYRSDLNDNPIPDDDPVDLGDGPQKIERVKLTPKKVAARFMLVRRVADRMAKSVTARNYIPIVDDEATNRKIWDAIEDAVYDVTTERDSYMEDGWRTGDISRKVLVWAKHLIKPIARKFKVDRETISHYFWEEYNNQD